MQHDTAWHDMENEAKDKAQRRRKSCKMGTYSRLRLGPCTLVSMLTTSTIVRPHRHQHLFWRGHVRRGTLTVTSTSVMIRA